MPLPPPDRRTLLRIARAAAAAAARGEQFSAPPPESTALKEPRGAFVTLRRGGALRGCIGTFEAAAPLYRAVAEMARSAAVGDPRFDPLRPAELPKVEVEISVLSPLRPARAQEVVVGRHGVYLERGPRRGVLLPQVAVEHGWDRETFLEQTCRKAGLPPDAWRHATTIYVFEAEVFGEKAGAKGD